MPSINTKFREQSLIEVMERCGGFLFVFLKGLCGDTGMAEDLLQKLWIYVFENFEEKDFGHIGYLKRKAFQLYVDETQLTKVKIGSDWAFHPVRFRYGIIVCTDTPSRLRSI